MVGDSPEGEEGTGRGGYGAAGRTFIESPCSSSPLIVACLPRHRTSRLCHSQCPVSSDIVREGRGTHEHLRDASQDRPHQTGRSLAPWQDRLWAYKLRHALVLLSKKPVEFHWFVQRQCVFTYKYNLYTKSLFGYCLRITSNLAVNFYPTGITRLNKLWSSTAIYKSQLAQTVWSRQK